VVGCVVSATAGLYFGDQAVTGVTQVATGAVQETYYVGALRDAGLSEREIFALDLTTGLVLGGGAVLAAKAPGVAAGGTPSTIGRGLVYENPTSLVQSRVDDLLSQIPANSQGRITMGVAVVEDAQGVRSVLISTSEPRGYLRPGVTLQPGEKVVAGVGHAEADIVSYANANRLTIIDIGATRPVCASCQNVIAPTGANTATPIKIAPKGSP
jgi:filamentous hemagglutinin